MSSSEFHENPTTGVVVITTSLREGRAWSAHWRESATVVTLRVLLLAVHLTLIFSPPYSLSSVVLYRYTKLIIIIIIIIYCSWVAVVILHAYKT